MSKVTGVHPDVVRRLWDDDGLGLVRHSWSNRTATSLPYCANPVPITLTALMPREGLSELRGEGTRVRVRGGDDAFGGTASVVLFVPCRRCRKCRYVRSVKLQEAIVDELRGANEHERTYFVTLTLRPREVGKLWTDARIASGSAQPAFKDLARALTRRLRLYLRRLRDRNARPLGGTLRYVAVVEPHRSGHPHCHLLITGTLTSKHIRRAGWPAGFIHVRLVSSDPGSGSVGKAAWYVAKYILKSADAVVIRSKLYGKPGRRLVGDKLPRAYGGLGPASLGLSNADSCGPGEAVVGSEHGRETTPPKDGAPSRHWSVSAGGPWNLEDPGAASNVESQLELALVGGGPPARLVYVRKARASSSSD